MTQLGIDRQRGCRLRIVTVLSAIVIALAGCGGVKARRVTAENRGRILAEIRHTRELTVEEVGLLQSYIARNSLRDALAGQEPKLPVGKTIGEVIQDERAFQRKALTEAREESLRVERAKKEDERQQAILRDAVTVTVFETRLDTQDYRTYMVCKVLIENHSAKDVRGFQGSLLFKDLFGDEIIRLGIKEDEVLSAGSSRRASRYWEYNRFIDEHTRWAGTKLANMPVTWEPTTVLFTDGTSLRAGEE